MIECRDILGITDVFCKPAIGASPANRNQESEQGRMEEGKDGRMEDAGGEGWKGASTMHE
jgi:hypothetical protein